MAIAADGPRGPRHRSKPGAVAAAANTGAPIIPVAVAAHPAWTLRSWDGFLMPAPWARVRVAYGSAYSVSATAGEELPAANEELQLRLEQVTRFAAV